MKKYIVVKTGVDIEEHLTKISPITDEQVSEIKEVIDAIGKFEPDSNNMEVGTLSPFTCNFCYGEGCNQYSEERTADEMYGHIPGYLTFKTFVPDVIKESCNILSVEIIDVTNELKLL